jgi:hypothetical protein
MHGTHSPARGRRDENPLAFGPQGLSHGIDQAFIGGDLTYQALAPLVELRDIRGGVPAAGETG